MATRAPFLTTRYGGYHHRDVPAEDAELTHVGPDTPCGEYMRRFWQPICFADDLRDLPLRVRILGEDLVVFRDFRRCRGAPGVALSAPGHLAGVWPDRRAGDTLLLPRLALRRGRDHPGDPGRAGHEHAEGPALPRRLPDPRVQRHRVRLHGTAGASSRRSPSTTASAGRAIGSCRAGNISIRATGCRSWKTPWTRSTPRFSTPSSAAPQFTDEFGMVPELDFAETPVGMIYIATRRVGDNIWARMVENVLAQPAAGGADLGKRPPGASVQWPDDEPLDRAAGRHQHDAHRIPARQRDRGRHAGVVGRSRHHAARPARRRLLRGEPAATRRLRGPGQSAAHCHPWPGASRATDRGVTMFRQQLRRGIRAVQAGQTPDGLFREAGRSSRPIATTRSCAFLPHRLRRRTRCSCGQPGGNWRNPTSHIHPS